MNNKVFSHCNHCYDNVITFVVSYSFLFYVDINCLCKIYTKSVLIAFLVSVLNFLLLVTEVGCRKTR